MLHNCRLVSPNSYYYHAHLAYRARVMAFECQHDVYTAGVRF
jgi:hypothetical protein